MKAYPALLKFFVLAVVLAPILASAEQDEKEWNNTLKNQYFSGRMIEESNSVIELETPVRAEDPALVPLKINTKIKQSDGSYIKKSWCWSTKTLSRLWANLNSRH